MKRFIQFKSWTIFTAAVVGAAYGGYAALRDPNSATSAGAIVLTMAVGAALLACTASALCRYAQIWQELGAYRARESATGMNHQRKDCNSHDASGNLQSAVRRKQSRASANLAQSERIR